VLCTFRKGWVDSLTYVSLFSQKTHSGSDRNTKAGKADQDALPVGAALERHQAESAQQRRRHADAGEALGIVAGIGQITSLRQ
jgi:hypothetical protein